MCDFDEYSYNERKKKEFHQRVKSCVKDTIAMLQEKTKIPSARKTKEELSSMNYVALLDYRNKLLKDYETIFGGQLTNA
jgi:hypothetical protein